ncbi:MAG: TIGR03084 family metal-binding protein [Alphaproteobacteria bacterium]
MVSVCQTVAGGHALSAEPRDGLSTAWDFRDESDALYTLVAPLKSKDWERKTQFKDWTINDVIGHLHIWNHAALLSLQDEDAFSAFMNDAVGTMRGPGGHLAFTREWLDGASGLALLDRWRELYVEASEAFAAADPKKRVKWAGPDMSVRSSITARLMETWSHAQAVYDLLGQDRVDTDRIRNVAVIGINTFGWTFKNRKLDVPEDKPYVRLTAPSGELWEWHEPSEDNLISGDATAFCQVVTQTRNIADTDLSVTGDTATRWMAMAQCFAGPPHDPPPPGTRFKQ